MLLSHCFAVVFALSALLAGLALAIDEGFGMEWTAAELAEARSVIARVSDAYNSGVGSSSSACDTKHDRIMRELQARFPSRTMVQVIDLYVNLTVETAAQPQDAGSAGDAAAVVHPTFAGGMPVVNNNDGMVHGGAAMEVGAVAVNGGDGEVVNPDNADDDVLWTDYEHRLILHLYIRLLL